MTTKMVGDREFYGYTPTMRPVATIAFSPTTFRTVQGSKIRRKGRCPLADRSSAEREDCHRAYSIASSTSLPKSWGTFGQRLAWNTEALALVWGRFIRPCYTTTQAASHERNDQCLQCYEPKLELARSISKCILAVYRGAV